MHVKMVIIDKIAENRGSCQEEQSLFAFCKRHYLSLEKWLVVLYGPKKIEMHQLGKCGLNREKCLKTDVLGKQSYVAFSAL